jgi:hypothetical protein
MAPTSGASPSPAQAAHESKEFQATSSPSVSYPQSESPWGISVPSHPVHEHESIFAPPTEGSEDLFGMPLPGSVVEIPPEPAASLPLPKIRDEKTSTESVPIISSNEIVPTSGPELTSEALNALMPPPHTSTDSAGTSDTSPSGGDWPALDTSGPAGDLPPDMGGPDLKRQAARRAKRESMFATYLIIILIPYAIFASCVAAYFYWRMMQMPHPMEYLRDTGENPPAKRGSSSVQEIISPETNLPPRLQVALGQAIRIGDLEIQPQKIERRKITICSESSRLPQLTANDALVLTLRLHNISQDVFFTPTDPFFDRKWKGELGVNRPYTLLDIAGIRFFGGPIKWSPRSTQGKGRAGDPREYVKGQEHDNQILKPGEERISIICTDPDNREILQALKNCQGPLVWRVHLRRGLVQVGDREVSASAVIGVVFDKKDIIGS